MLDKRNYYNKVIAISEEDMQFIKELKSVKLGKKSMAGILSMIIKEYKDKLKETNPR